EFRRVLFRSSVDGGQVGGHSDVGDDHLQVIFADDLADVAFHPGDVLVGHLQAGAGRCFHVDHKLARVGAWEKGDTKQREQLQAHHKAAHDESHGGHRSVQCFGNCDVIPAQHAVVAMIEAGDKFSKH